MTQSASYTLDFGYAVAALVGNRSRRPSTTMVDLAAYSEWASEDDLGALDDFHKGPKLAWWKRKPRKSVKGQK